MGSIHSLIIGGTSGIGRFLVEEWSESSLNKISVVGRHRPNKKFDKYRDVKWFLSDISQKRNINGLVKKVVHQQGKVNNIIFFQRFRGGKKSWQGEIEVGLNATKEIIDQFMNNFEVGKTASIVIVATRSAGMPPGKPTPRICGVRTRRGAIATASPESPSASRSVSMPKR